MGGPSTWRSRGPPAKAAGLWLRYRVHSTVPAHAAGRDPRGGDLRFDSPPGGGTPRSRLRAGRVRTARGTSRRRSTWPTATGCFTTSRAGATRRWRRFVRALRPGGLFALWENNPWNPGTRWSCDGSSLTATPSLSLLPRRERCWRQAASSSNARTSCSLPAPPRGVTTDGACPGAGAAGRSVPGSCQKAGGWMTEPGSRRRNARRRLGDPHRTATFPPAVRAEVPASSPPVVPREESRPRVLAPRGHGGRRSSNASSCD